MVISSRTPEGDPNRCPICGHDCRLEPSQFLRDAPCPRCGCLLSFELERGPVSEGTVSILLRLAETRLGTPPPELLPALEELVTGPETERILERVLTAASWDELLADE
jgi:hypothetical protein